MEIRDSDQFLTPSQAARRLRISPQWVLKLIQSGRLQAVRTPLGHLVEVASVEELRQEREQRGKIPAGVCR